jgi:hypothetical protein
MRKISILLIVLAFSGSVANSQDHLGFSAGLNLSNQAKEVAYPQMPSTQIEKTRRLFGYQFGAFYKKRLHSQLLVSTEANFSLLGSKTKYVTEQQLLNPDGKDYYYNEKVGYIQVPVSLQLYLNRVYFGAGPSVGIRLFSKITNFDNGSYNIPFYRTIDAAANILAGYTVSNKMALDVRYSHGLVNVYKEYSYYKTKNRFFNVSLLYFVY